MLPTGSYCVPQGPQIPLSRVGTTSGALETVICLRLLLPPWLLNSDGRAGAWRSLVTVLSTRDPLSRVTKNPGFCRRTAGISLPGQIKMSTQPLRVPSEIPSGANPSLPPQARSGETEMS